MSERGSFIDHFNEFNTVIYQLNSMDLEFDDEIWVLLILCSFMDSWSILVMIVSNVSLSYSKIVFDNEVGILLSKIM